jgi:crotonobetainyl-CoA:carnitine CoA-transferase CaiB-like acyl-CoA transferase
VRVEEAATDEALNHGRPLEGVRVLALEQMQALPFATQLLARLGAEVVKVESPDGGDSGRLSLPAMTDPQGRMVGATYLRNNLNKRSISINLKDPRGRQLVLDLASRFDVFAENFKGGALNRLGLGYDAVRAANDRIIYVSVSGFGNDDSSPYHAWPAYAPVVEAMSGLYETKRKEGEAPRVAPGGSLGDMGTSMFATVGILAALYQRDRTGVGQQIDVAMLDSTVAMTDIITNYWSLGMPGGAHPPIIMHGFEASDGWFILQVGRVQQFASLARVVGHPEWISDPSLADRQGWYDAIETVIRPAIEKWAADKTKLESCELLGEAGLAAGPCFRDDEVVVDPHLVGRDMLVEMARPDGVDQPVVFPNNPIRMSGVPAGGPVRRVPWFAEHTDEVLRADLALEDGALAELRQAGVIV